MWNKKPNEWGQPLAQAIARDGLCLSGPLGQEAEMGIQELVFVGIKRRVLAFERSTGTIVWEVTLKAALFDEFVNLFFDRDALFATTGGRLFCLDPATGRIRWENPLKGCGYGIATIASVIGSSGNPPVVAEMRNRERQAASGS